MRRSVKVILWGEEIGRLISDSASQTSYFYFNDKLSDTARKAFPIGFAPAMFHSRIPVPGEARPPFNGVPPFISDSLPDAWGNELFEQWRMANRISSRQVTACDKLAFIGTRGMGALEFRPEENLGLKDTALDVGSLARVADIILREREDAVIGGDDELSVKALIAVGSSIGGRQAKALLAIDRASGEIRSGQIAGLPGHDYHILKFNIPERDAAETEHCYYTLATACGIEMMPSELITVDGVSHFLTKRFDRGPQGEKIHLQTVAALAPEVNSYEGMMEVCRALNLPAYAREQLFARMVFNILANNTDDHTRNFSFSMSHDGVWSLCPAYDMTFIFDTGGWRGNREHCITLGGRTRDLRYDDAMRLAADSDIRHPDDIIARVSHTLMSFRAQARRSGIRDSLTARMADTIDSNLEAWRLLPAAPLCSFTAADGSVITAAHIDAAYRSGNFHLLGEVNGVMKKYVITKSHDAYQQLLTEGIRSIDEATLRTLAERHLTGNHSQPDEVE